MNKSQRQFIVVFPTLVLFFYPFLHTKIREQLGTWLCSIFNLVLAALLGSLAIVGEQTLLLSIALVNGLSFLFFFAFVFDSDLENRAGRRIGNVLSVSIQWLPRLLSIAVSFFGLFLLYLSGSSESIITVEFGALGKLQLDAASSVQVGSALIAWVAVQIVIYLKFWNYSILDYIGERGAEFTPT